MNKRMILLMVVLSSILFAEKSEIYLFGGVTFASICYDDNYLQSNVDMSARTGFNFGIDMTEKNFKGGIGFTQFGSNFDLSSLGYGEASDTYNYITFYATICHPLQQVKFFGGIQGGKSIGGTATIEGVDSNTISADNFNFDFGVLAGIEAMLTPKFGLRASYYYGFANVIKGAYYNYKNRGISICLLTKIQ